jgi:3,4-dihydroxy-2-butanone 4-phosphate synthase
MTPSTEKSILVLARRDHTEAMRVAAGLTIFGHVVDLVFMTHVVEESGDNEAQAELLELAEIVPRTTVSDEALEHLGDAALAQAIANADLVVSL